MKVVCVLRRMDGRRVLERTDDVGDVLPAVYQELEFHWLPRFIKELQTREMGIWHPTNQEWSAVFRIDYQSGSTQSTGKLLIRPMAYGRQVPEIVLSRDQPLTIQIVRRRVQLFLGKLSPPRF